MYGVTHYTRPSIWSESWSGRMSGWRGRAATWISLRRQVAPQHIYRGVAVVLEVVCQKDPAAGYRPGSIRAGGGIET
jgi:hypothetical protein